MTLPDYPALFWVTAALAVVFVGISKAGFGSGPGILATPLVALTIPVPEAAALLLPLLIVADLAAVRHYRRDYDLTSLKVLLPAAVVGIALGGLFFGYFSHNERILKMGIGVIAILFVLFQLGRSTIVEALERHRPPAAAGALLGALGGFTSTLAHAGGPPVVMYLLPQQLPRRLFVGTTVIVFMVINVVKLVPYAMLGLLKIGNLTTILLLAPFALIGVWLGVWLNRHFREDWFNIVVYALLLVTGLDLLLR